MILSRSLVLKTCRVVGLHAGPGRTCLPVRARGARLRGSSGDPGVVLGLNGLALLAAGLLLGEETKEGKEDVEKSGEESWKIK